jgi:DNA-binding transcriptional LysR family regulator
MQPEIRWLRAFLAVAKENHFSRAARGLNLAQPALTTQIQQLEEAVGARLFERTNRLTGLTPAGRLLVPEAQAIVDLADNLSRVARRAQGGESGQLRLGIIPPAATGSVAEALRRFTQRLPDVEVQVKQGGQQLLEARLQAGDLDVVVGRKPHSAVRTLGYRRLATEEQGVLLRADDPLAGSKVVPLDALDGRRLVLLRGNPAFGQNLLSLAAKNQVTLTALHTAEDFPSIHWMVRAGIGVAPCSLLLEDTLSAGLVARRLRPSPPRLELYNLWRGKTESPTVARWLEMVTRTFA